jgi:hypothetical protein
MTPGVHKGRQDGRGLRNERLPCSALRPRFCSPDSFPSTLLALAADPEGCTG